MDYRNYTVIDFTLAAAAADENFCQWVIRPDEMSDKFWNEWLEQYPYKREEIEEARNWILLLGSLEGYSLLFQLEKEVALQRIMIKIRKKVKRLGDHSEQSAQHNDTMEKEDKIPTPPCWADRLLESFCAPYLLEEVQGDLHELYGKWVQQHE